MANTLLTTSKITKAAAVFFESQLGFGKQIDWEWEEEFGNKGAQIGDVLRIRKPVQPKVITGATYTAQDLSEGQVLLAVLQHYQVPLQFSQYDLAMEIEEFSDRFIKPATQVLAAQIDAALYAQAINGTGTTSLVSATAISNNAANQVQGAYGTPLTSATVSKAMRMLDEHSCPPDERYGILTPQALDELRGNQISFFNPTQAISGLYRSGNLGEFYGAEWSKSQSAIAGTRTNGAWAGSPVLASAQSVATGWQTNYSFTVNGFTAATTINAGDVFTIAGVYDVNPLTKSSLTNLKQFVVLTAVASAANSAQTIIAAPAPAAITNGYQNVSINPPSGAALTLVGTASSSGGESLVFHRSAFAAASPKFELPQSAEMAKQISLPSGPNIAFTKTWDAVNYRWICRLDTMLAFAVVTNEFAVRIRD